jgi:tRNA pseudouridine65 synthase
MSLLVRICLFSIVLISKYANGFHLAKPISWRSFELYVQKYEPFGDETVTILSRGPSHIVAYKPPSVVCHHSCWSGSRAILGEHPMLQRVRDAMHDIDYNSDPNIPIRRVNLVHRLDRGASGALLLAFADEEDADNSDLGKESKGKGATSQLIDAMASDDAIKTYVALVRGEGILKGEDLKQKGWFEVNREIKDENGNLNNATTEIFFVAGQPETVDENGNERPRMSIVLARPKEGRWHQIRRHLNGLSHPILGDSSHGSSTVNREWKEKRNLPGERICLHMARMQLPPTDAVPEGIDVTCPIPTDMLQMLHNYAPNLLNDALNVFKQEGIIIESTQEYEVGKYSIPDELSEILANEDGNVDILLNEKHFVVANKPPCCVVHDSAWTSKKVQKKFRYKEPMPMLQRVRNATGLKVNPIHRLDRGASGCLIFSVVHQNEDSYTCQVTRDLMENMQSKESSKTYIALVDGDGTWNDNDFLRMGWIHMNNPIKDESGNLITDAHTDIRFIGSTTLSPLNGKTEGRKISMVLAKPSTGKWHQIRQHLASGFLGHAILGDSSHGRTRTNRIWKRECGMKQERVCLHLVRVQIPPCNSAPNGIDVMCPLADDLLDILKQTPELVESAIPRLIEEGLEGYLK